MPVVSATACCRSIVQGCTEEALIKTQLGVNEGLFYQGFTVEVTRKLAVSVYFLSKSSARRYNTSNEVPAEPKMLRSAALGSTRLWHLLRGCTTAQVLRVWHGMSTNPLDSNSLFALGPLKRGFSRINIIVHRYFLRVDRCS